MVTCKECKKEKQPSGFYKHPLTKNGIMGRCKDCIKKGRRSESERVMARKRDLDRYHNNPERNAYVKKSSLLRRKKKGYGKTHSLVRRRLLKSIGYPEQCPICNKEGRTEAHHPSYSEPLKIVFCCSLCHSKIHTGEIDEENCKVIDLERISGKYNPQGIKKYNGKTISERSKITGIGYKKIYQRLRRGWSIDKALLN